MIRRCCSIIHFELNIILSNFEKNGIELIQGVASFANDNVIDIQNDFVTESIYGEKIIIAVGTLPARPEHIDFSNSQIFCSDTILEMEKLPKSMIIVGGGVIGTEYACILSTLGIEITIIEGRGQLLDFLDSEIAEALQYHLRDRGVILRLNEKVDKIEESKEEY